MDSPEFVRVTRAGIVRFRDRSAAIAAGYRRLGPAFPGMGEHWIHPGLIVRGAVDPGEPAVLCYADVDGSVRLLGAAYAFALARGAPLPPLPGGAENWHIHQDAIDEETLLLVHPAVHASSGMRLVMTHVWTELDNPSGVFAQNNWMLPFVQAGLVPSIEPTRDAAQALSLLTSGTAYYERLFAALAAPDDAERGAIAAVLREARDSVVSWEAALPAQSSTAVERRRGAEAGEAPRAQTAAGRREVAAEEMSQLADVWAWLWSTLEGKLAPATFSRLRAWEGAASHAHDSNAAVHDAQDR